MNPKTQSRSGPGEKGTISSDSEDSKCSLKLNSASFDSLLEEPPEPTVEAKRPRGKRETYIDVQNYTPSPGPVSGSRPAPPPALLGANVTRPTGLGNTRASAKTGGDTESPSGDPAGE